MIPIKSKEELETHCCKKGCKFCEMSCLELKKLCDKNIKNDEFVDDIVNKLFPLIIKHNRKAKLEKLLK